MSCELCDNDATEVEVLSKETGTWISLPICNQCLLYGDEWQISNLIESKFDAATTIH